MGVGETVLHREKISFPAWFRWFVPLALLGGIGIYTGAAIAAGDPLPVLVGAAMLPLVFLSLAMFATLRVAVTEQNLIIQYGLFGPTIPLSRIEHCEAVEYDLWKAGGYGIRYSLIDRAWYYNMPGDKGQAVRVHWRDEKGRLKRSVIASKNHQALANAINQARAACASEETGAGEEVIYDESYDVDAEALAKAVEAEEAVEVAAEEEA